MGHFTIICDERRLSLIINWIFSRCEFRPNITLYQPVAMNSIVALFAKVILITVCSIALLGCDSKVNLTAVAALQKRAKDTNTSGLVVYIGDSLIVNDSFGSKPRLQDAMSATKSVVNLAIGKLLTDSLIRSIDEPVSLYYPEWKQGNKKEITIRHLMNHTSGLQSDRMTNEIYKSPDFVQLALSAQLNDPPGSKFFYNNKATNLLAGIVQKASGIRMDHYLKAKLFDPLGMKDYLWLTDSFLHHYNSTGIQDTAYLRQGNPIAMAELLITPLEFAKLGLFILNKGKIADQQVIDEAWLEELFKAGQDFDPTCGLLWWLIYDPETSFVSFREEQLEKLEQLKLDEWIFIELKSIKGDYKRPIDFSNRLDSLPSIQAMGGRMPFRLKLFEMGFYENIYEWHTTKVIGISAKGTYGQYLTIYPDKGIVAVRMIDPENYSGAEDDFAEFEYMVYDLVK